MARKALSIVLEDKALNAQLTKALAASPVAATKALMDCVLDLSAESARRAPIETGDLRNNCHGQVQGQTVYQNQQPAAANPLPGQIVEGSVGYSLPYARRQHEDLSLRHSGPEHGKVDGGEAKYLERPFDEKKQLYASHIGKAVTDTLK